MTDAERRVVALVREELERLYGERLRGVVLYGSRARGDARGDSDYDLLAVLEPPWDHWDELMRLADLGFDLLADAGAFVSVKPVRPSDLERQTVFMENVRREGVSV